MRIKKNSLFLAPMAGVTDTVFRALCKKMGADFVYTEFVSANGIIRENKEDDGIGFIDCKFSSDKNIYFELNLDVGNYVVLIEPYLYTS